MIGWPYFLRRLGYIFFSAGLRLAAFYSAAKTHILFRRRLIRRLRGLISGTEVSNVTPSKAMVEIYNGWGQIARTCAACILHIYHSYSLYDVLDIFSRTSRRILKYSLLNPSVRLLNKLNWVSITELYWGICLLMKDVIYKTPSDNNRPGRFHFCFEFLK